MHGAKVVHGEAFVCLCGTFLILALHRSQHSLVQSSFCGKNRTQIVLLLLWTGEAEEINGPQLPFSRETEKLLLPII